MTLARKRSRAVTGAAVALLLCSSAPRLNAQVVPMVTPVDGIAGSADCTHDRTNNGVVGIPGDVQGRTDGTQDIACQDQGVEFIGPKVGQVATVIGPTIIGGVIDEPIQVGPGAHTVDPTTTMTTHS